MRARCKEPGLKGTMLLAEEGSNRFLAGATADVESCPATLRQTGAGVTAADEPI
jgi:predicted sulfurtransferase